MHTVQHAQLPRLLYGCSSMQNSGLQNRKMRGHGLPPVPNAGSLPPVKARRRQNTINQPERCKQSGKPIRSAARWQTATGLREPEKVCPASACADSVTDAVTHRRTLHIKAEPRIRTRRQMQRMKKALRTCYLQRVRPAQHKPVGRDALFLRRKGFRGNQAHANAWAFCFGGIRSGTKKILD